MRDVRRWCVKLDCLTDYCQVHNLTHLQVLVLEHPIDNLCFQPHICIICTHHLYNVHIPPVVCAQTICIICTHLLYYLHTPSVFLAHTICIFSTHHLYFCTHHLQCVHTPHVYILLFVVEIQVSRKAVLLACFLFIIFIKQFKFNFLAQMYIQLII